MVPSMAAPRKKTPPPLTELARKQLGQVGHLVEDVSRHYIARLQREIAEIIRAVEKKNSGKGLSRSQERDLRRLLDLIARLQINPERGRRKDLKKLDSLIGEFQACVENW